MASRCVFFDCEREGEGQRQKDRDTKRQRGRETEMTNREMTLN
jgi:hypothetical protein